MSERIRRSYDDALYNRRLLYYFTAGVGKY